MQWPGFQIFTLPCLFNALGEYSKYILWLLWLFRCFYSISQKLPLWVRFPLCLACESTRPTSCDREWPYQNGKLPMPWLSVGRQKYHGIQEPECLFGIASHNEKIAFGEFCCLWLESILVCECEWQEYTRRQTKLSAGCWPTLWSTTTIYQMETRNHRFRKDWLKDKHFRCWPPPAGNMSQKLVLSCLSEKGQGVENFLP